jgi:purine-binding chemotaxis protein CheW
MTPQALTVPATSPAGGPAATTASEPVAQPASLAGYGGFCIGNMQLALPMAALREVVPCLGLLALPCPAACVVGGIDLRGVLVPVVDLRIVFGRTPGATAAASVIIMVHGGCLLGLLADGVTGIFLHADGSESGAHYAVQPTAQPAAQPSAHKPAPGTAPAATLAATRADPAALYAGSIRRADTGALVSVLSAAALTRMPQVPMTPDPAPQRLLADTAAIDQAHGAAQMPVMLVRCGRIAMAIDALAVHATLSDPAIHGSVLAQGECMGVVDYAGQHIAAVDLLALCGLGRLQRQAPMQAFVVRFDQGYVALLVDAVLDVVSVSRPQVVPVPAFALPRPRLFTGALPADIMPPSAVAAAGAVAHVPALPQFLLLDAVALRATPELLGLSQTNTPSPDAQAQGMAATGQAAQGETQTGAGIQALARREMITYELFGEEASPIEQVSEILRYEPGTAVFAPQGAFLGLMINRGRSIPVMCLRRLAGLEPLPLDATSSVLVVASDSDWVGFAVPRLRAIETVHWSPVLPQSGLGEHDAMAQALGSREMALVDSGGCQRMLRVLDLAGIARGMREQALAA